MDDEVMTLEEAAEYLKVHPTTLYRLVRRGQVPGRKMGGSWRFHRSGLEAWLGKVKPRVVT